MYRAVKTQESLYAQSLVVPVSGESRDDTEETEHVKDIDEINKSYVKNEITKEEARETLAKLTVVPPDLHKIQPRPSQVWNCDEIGIDPNGKWTKVVCTYKFCMVEQIWKMQTGEHAPFWCTLLLWSRADGQCFIPPTVVHQGTNMTEDLQLYLPAD